MNLFDLPYPITFLFTIVNYFIYIALSFFLNLYIFPLHIFLFIHVCTLQIYYYTISYVSLYIISHFLLLFFYIYKYTILCINHLICFNVDLEKRLSKKKCKS